MRGVVYLRMEWQRSEQNAGRLKPQAGQVDVELVMDGHVLHGRNDDPLNVSTRIADVVHGRVSAVLSIVLIAVLGTFLDIVEVLPIWVHELDLSAVSVDVDDGP